MRRVVITGMGTVNPLGKNVEEFWENIKANKNGLSYVDQFDTENFPVKIIILANCIQTFLINFILLFVAPLGYPHKKEHRTQIQQKNKIYDPLRV